MFSLQMRPKENHQQAVNRVSLNNVFSRISCNEKKSEVHADELLRQCKERLRTDPNYNSNDYDMDYIRLRVLKFVPEKHTEQSKKENLMPDSEDDFFLADHSFASTSNGLFNSATQNTTSSSFRR